MDCRHPGPLACGLAELGALSTARPPEFCPRKNGGNLLPTVLHGCASSYDIGPPQNSGFAFGFPLSPRKGHQLKKKESRPHEIKWAHRGTHGWVPSQPKATVPKELCVQRNPLDLRQCQSLQEAQHVPHADSQGFPGLPKCLRSWPKSELVDQFTQLGPPVERLD